MLLNIPFWQEMLVYIKSKVIAETISDIHVSLRVTYSHACKLVYEMENEGYLKVYKKGRTKKVELTEEGKEIATLCEKLLTKVRWKRE